MTDSSPDNNQTNPGEDLFSTEETHNSLFNSQSKDFMDKDDLKTQNLTFESHDNLKIEHFKSEEVLKLKEDQLNFEDDNNMELDDPGNYEQVKTNQEMEENNLNNRDNDNFYTENVDVDQTHDDNRDTENDTLQKDDLSKDFRDSLSKENKDTLDLNKNDDDLVGLFEDSDELENQEVKPVPVVQPVEEEKEKPVVTENVPEVIDTTLNVIPRPKNEDNLVICKFPPTLFVSSHPHDLRTFLKSNPKILSNPPNLNNLPILCWKSVGFHSNKYDDDNNNNTTDYQNNQNTNKELMSNGKLVLWDDGSLTLFVGRVPLDCEFRPEVSFLLEDSRLELKPVHAQVNTRLQTRFSNLLKNDLIKKNVKVKRQKMEVTSLSDAIQSQYTLQQNLMNVKENERYRRSHYSSKGLTKAFLESSDVEDDDELL